jgi:hypothetical protein
MEAASTFETSVNFYQTSRRYNPEDSHLQIKTSVTTAARDPHAALCIRNQFYSFQITIVVCLLVAFLYSAAAFVADRAVRAAETSFLPFRVRHTLGFMNNLVRPTYFCVQ